MAFGGLEKKQPAAPVADINMTPLIDVMLVLLVIFILTAPLLGHAIRLDLPKVAAAAAPSTPQTVTLSIDATGRLYWNGTALPFDALRARLVRTRNASAQTEIHLRAARDTRYDAIAQVMGAVQQAGIERLAFVTEPPQDGAPSR